MRSGVQLNTYVRDHIYVVINIIRICKLSQCSNGYLRDV